MVRADSYSWFALTAQPRHEKSVAENLRRKGLESFVPLYRACSQWTNGVTSVDLPLFPGFVFCRFADVRKMAGSGSAGTPVANHEIARIRAIQSSGLPAQPWPYPHAGQKARIERGSLAGLEGVLIREKESLRVVVSVESLRRAVAVEIGRDIIRAVAGTAYASMAHVYLVNRSA